MIGLFNFGQDSVTIEKGQRIAQGIFAKYLKATEDDAQGLREGGIGSTGN